MEYCSTSKQPLLHHSTTPMNPDSFTFGGEIVWRPSREYVDRSHTKRFMDLYGIGSFSELIERSTSDVPWFTDAVLKYLDIQFRTPYTDVLDLSRGASWPQWCVGGEMNIAYNCVDKYRGGPADGRTAVTYESEEGRVKHLTYGRLADDVCRCANAMRGLGIRKGDSVGIFMPMTMEIVIALLACAKVGAIALPLFSGYGQGAVASRLADADAKLLFTADGFFRRGKAVPMKPVADEALPLVPSIRNVIVVQRALNPVYMKRGRDHWWHDAIPGQAAHAETEPTSAEDPLILIYTSGTTGRPKGIAHSHCGFPVKAAQDMAFGMDLHPGETLYWLTDMGWMMGPWLVYGSLLLGGTMMIYDGAPDYPGPDRLWSMTAKHKIYGLGVSPTLVRALMKYGEDPVSKHDLSSLHLFGSTGEPWNPESWNWLFETVGRKKRPIINYSGGTEISGGILMGNPTLPLKPCAFSAPCPGIAADVFDDQGNSIRNQVGELVIKAPWIGMARGFWKDPERYLETYWSRWPNVWAHGDFAAVDSDDMWYILGRSDDTIKVAGKRVGPAEVESVLAGHQAVLESAAIGVPDELKGSEVVCFCVLRPGHEPSSSLSSELRELVAQALGRPLKPREVLFVSDLPKTRNAKVMRRVVRAAYQGQDLGDLSSLENPDAVKEIAAARSENGDKPTGSTQS